MGFLMALKIRGYGCAQPFEATDFWARVRKYYIHSSIGTAALGRIPATESDIVLKSMV